MLTALMRTKFTRINPLKKLPEIIPEMQSRLAEKES